MSSAHAAILERVERTADEARAAGTPDRCGSPRGNSREHPPQRVPMLERVERSQSFEPGSLAGRRGTGRYSTEGWRRTGWG